MELKIDLDNVLIKLVNPADFSVFRIVIGTPASARPDTQSHRLGDVVAAQHVGVLRSDGDVAVEPDVIRFMAAGQGGDGWEQGFRAMISVAEHQGWIDDRGRIQAHVVWPNGERIPTGLQSR